MSKNDKPSPPSKRINYGHVPDKLRQSIQKRIGSIIDWEDANNQSWLTSFVQQRLAASNISDPRIGIIASMAEAKKGAAGDGTVLVSGSGEILFADHNARSLIEERIWLEDRDGVLAGVGVEFEQALSALLADTLAPGSGNICVRLDDRMSGAPLFVRAGVLRLPEEPNDTAPFVILHLRPEEASLDLDQQCLMTWYAMTETEAKVAVAFAAGISLADYAKMNAVSINTVRTLFARLKAKLNAADQAAVVRKVLVAALRR